MKTESISSATSKADAGALAGRQHSRFYERALAVSAAFQILHMIALPIAITWDGGLYIQLARSLFKEDCLKNWDFFRTPLFPLFINVFCGLFGEHSMAVILLNTLVGFLGIWILGSVIKRMGYSKAAGVVMLVLSVYPTLIAYQHVLLCDIGLFCWLSATIGLTLWRPNGSVPGFMRRKSAALILIVTMGYYYKPNLLYMGPVIAFLSMLFMARLQGETGWRAILRNLSSRDLVHTGLVIAIPFLLSMPWKYLGDRPGKYGVQTRMSEVYVVGLFNQLVVQPGDAAVGPELSPEFEKAIAGALVNGRLPLDGVGGAVQYIALQRAEYFRAHSSFLHEVRLHPIRYAKGVVRAVLVFCGMQGRTVESKTYIMATMPVEPGLSASIYGLPPEVDSNIRERFAQRTGASVLSVTLRSLDWIFDWLVILGSLATFVGFVVGVVRADVRLIVLTGLPLAFIAMHSVVLMSFDRYAFPTYATGLANLVLCPLLIFEKTLGTYYRSSSLSQSRTN